MKKTRYVRKPMPHKITIEFADAEEAWFWFIRSERARREGAKLSQSSSNQGRPCEPDDIYRAVMRLYNRRVISGAQLKILAEFGWRESPPDGRVRAEERAFLMWDDALDRLNTELKTKGIVRHGAHYSECG